MYLKILWAPTTLAAPPITLENASAKFAIEFRV
jgi:hypothetical protein